MKNALIFAALSLSMAMGSTIAIAANNSAGTGKVCADILANKHAYSPGRVRMCQSAVGVSPTFHRGHSETPGSVDRERRSGAL